MAEDRASPDAIAIALRVGEAIESVGGAYFVGGSLASSLQGEPRATNDIDLVIDVPAARIADLVDALGDDFEVDVDMLRDALLNARSCNIFRKLLWYLEGGSISERQWRDVVEVLRVSGPTMDRSYLESWADELHLRELLGRAIGEASGGSTG